MSTHQGLESFLGEWGTVTAGQLDPPPPSQFEAQMAQTLQRIVEKGQGESEESGAYQAAQEARSLLEQQGQQLPQGLPQYTLQLSNRLPDKYPAWTSQVTYSPPYLYAARAIARHCIEQPKPGQPTAGEELQTVALVAGTGGAGMSGILPVRRRGKDASFQRLYQFETTADLVTSHTDEAEQVTVVDANERPVDPGKVDVIINASEYPLFPRTVELFPRATVINIGSIAVEAAREPSGS